MRIPFLKKTAVQQLSPMKQEQSASQPDGTAVLRDLLAEEYAAVAGAPEVQVGNGTRPD